MTSPKKKLEEVFFKLTNDSDPTMGFELETDIIKVNTKDLTTLKTQGMFTEFKFGYNINIINNNMTKPLWSIHSDTIDQSYANATNSEKPTEEQNEYNKNGESFKRNLEVNTLGGWNEKQIPYITQLVVDTFSQIIELVKDNTLRNENILLTPHRIKELTPSEARDMVEANNIPDTKNFELRYFGKTNNPYRLRPQITYQLPLSKIPSLFNRIQTHFFPQIVEFLKKIQQTTKSKKVLLSPSDLQSLKLELKEKKKISQEKLDEVEAV